jgi:hypothetical protein
MLVKVVERIAILVVSLLLLTVAARSHRYQEQTTRAAASVNRLTANARQTMVSIPRAAVAISKEKALRSNDHSPAATSVP